MSKKNFKYLDELIHSGAKEIILDSDITIEKSEKKDYYGDMYPGGIPIDVDDIVIDGNGHTINGDKKVQIFNISGKNITIKNLTLKNGLKKREGIRIRNRDKAITSRGGAIINSGEVKVINCNIINNSGRFGGGINNSGTMTIEKSVIKNNTSIRDAGAISNGGKLTIIDSTIEKNSSKEGGGAISSGGELRIINCKILNNNTGYLDDRTYFTPNGTIENGGQLEIKDSVFENNMSENGGVINNGSVVDDNYEVILEKCVFRKNQSKMNRNTIENWKGNIKIRDCTFSENKAEGNIVYNKDSLEVYNTDFIENNSQKVLYNHMDSNLEINGGTLSKNRINETLIFNTGKFFLIKDTIIESNNAKTGKITNIENEYNLILDQPKINDEGKSILNKGTVLIRTETEGLEEKIDNHGIVKKDPLFKEETQTKPEENQTTPKTEKETQTKPEENQTTPKTEKETQTKPEEGNPTDTKLTKDAKNFSHLNNIIETARKSDLKTIELTDDVILKDYEEPFFEGGIELDIDDLTIEGNGKIIDGGKISRIFYITGKNITIKDITFQNGMVHKNYDNFFNSHGGALRINKQGTLNIEGCKFLKNSSESFGGSIYNRGEISINGVSLLENSGNEGGAIYNLGISTIQNSAIERNSSINLGGAIYNAKKLEICDSTIKENITKGEIDSAGGGIYNTDEMKLKDTTITDNQVPQGIGGGILNQGEATIIKCKILKNNAPSGGGIRNGGKLEIRNTTIEKNKGTTGAGLYAGGQIEISDCEFLNNDAERHGGAIEITTKDMSMRKIIFKENSAKEGGAIHYNSIGDYEDVKEEECEFIGNHPNDHSSVDVFASMKIKDLEKDYEKDQETRDKLLVYSTFLTKSKIDLLNSIVSDFKNGSFAYLKELIESNGEITLSQDISFYNSTDNDLINGINIEKDIIIDGKGHSIDGKSKASFFKISNDRRVILKNIKFVNAYSRITPIINNEGSLEILNSEFHNNRSDSEGMIKNSKDGAINLENCKFNENSTGKNGGTIHNFGKITAKDTKFTKNTAGQDGGTIKNVSSGEMTLIKTSFEENMAHEDGGAIINFGKITAKETIFAKNSVKENHGGAINNQSKGEITLEKCEFNENTAQKNGGAIINFGKITSEKSSFAKNTANQDGGAINNLKIGELTLINTSFNKNTAQENGGAINNKLDGNINIHNCEFNENTAQENGGAITNFSKINTEATSFGKNTANQDGGAINNQIGGEININDCEFNENTANETGGTIINWGKIDVQKSSFTKNTASRSGGAVNNQPKGEIDIHDCRFQGNKSNHGGAIISFNNLKLYDSIFEENESENGGAINSQNGKLTVKNTKFINNKSIAGGAIVNFNILNIYKSYFELNKAERNGGVLFNLSNSETHIENTIFSKNIAENFGGSILNQGKTDILDSVFDSNQASSEGGAINNQSSGIIHIARSEFINNESRAFGAIYSANSESYTITNCKFDNNMPDIGVDIEKP